MNHSRAPEYKKKHTNNNNNKLETRNEKSTEQKEPRPQDADKKLADGRTSPISEVDKIIELQHTLNIP